MPGKMMGRPRPSRPDTSKVSPWILLGMLEQQLTNEGMITIQGWDNAVALTEQLSAGMGLDEDEVTDQ